MQGWQEKNTELLHDPWFSIWRNPRETMREILDVDPNRYVLLLAVAAGFIEALEWATEQHLGDDYPLFVVLLICALAGAAGGLLFLHIGAWVMQRIGGWLGGKASFVDMRAAMAWSTVPIIWTSLFWLPAIAIFGNRLFQSTDLELPEMVWIIPPLVVVAIAAIIIGIWALYIFINCVAEAHRFSVWHALLTAFLVFILVVVTAIVIALPFELLAA